MQATDERRRASDPRKKLGSVTIIGKNTRFFEDTSNACTCSPAQTGNDPASTSLHSKSRDAHWGACINNMRPTHEEDSERFLKSDCWGECAPLKATMLEAFMVDEQKPKKVGVYDGPGAAAGLNWTWIIIAAVALVVIAYMLLR